MGSIPTLATPFRQDPTGRSISIAFQNTLAGRAVSSPSSDDFVDVASVKDVPPGTDLEVDIDDQVLILSNVEGELYAVTAWCTHQGTSLALGQRSGPILICWAHLWRFDVRTGKPVWPPLAQIAPGYALRTHPVRVEGDRVLVSRVPGRPNPPVTEG